MEDACGGDRLQVAVLLFLSTIVKGGRRFNSIHPFGLKIVNDLEEVKKFPWGRITFEDTMNQIDHLMKKRLNGKVKVDHLFGGFIVPLEVLAFECIPELSKQFQEGVIGANDGCPRMCKKKFKDNGMTCFPLKEVNQALGTTKDIISIMQPSVAEETLLLDIME
ncbi:unnamed protein product [Arabidopsis arenosa]|uniref:DUF1985 domain-containing protein n=1 Tax=Arabidopsis arenosa TaxID=38785 RepID=A0A8S2A4R0_ARAAE|nr:unnamed protein product [Arabidopsis arenosa]